MTPRHRLTRKRGGAMALAAALTLALATPSLSPAAPATATGTARSVQQRLVTLRYLPASAVTGSWDYRTTEAVMAFQGWQGLARDGKVGPQTLAALSTAKPPQPRWRTPGRRVEVFRAQGVTLLVDGDRVVRAIHTSSGKPGFTTPTGTYQVFRKELRSWSHQYKVVLPYASYFNRGIAFHSYPQVPAYPASHGCIRVPAPEAAGLYAFAKMSTPVVVY